MRFDARLTEAQSDFHALRFGREDNIGMTAGLQ